MSKAGELDWSDLIKGNVGEPEDSLSKSFDSAPNKGGEYITKEDLKKDAEFILQGFQGAGIRSPSKKESEDFIEKVIISTLPPVVTDEKWNNKPNNAFEQLKAAKVQNEPDNIEEFGKCKSFNDSLGYKELLERNMYTE